MKQLIWLVMATLSVNVVAAESNRLNRTCGTLVAIYGDSYEGTRGQEFEVEVHETTVGRFRSIQRLPLFSLVDLKLDLKVGDSYCFFTGNGRTTVYQKYVASDSEVLVASPADRLAAEDMPHD